MGTVNTTDDARDFWNAKARTFPRFEDGENNYEAGMLRIARENGVDFKGKKVLDVGCGSGMYTIRIAREAQSVTAVDISEEMLRILKEDSQALGINNITCILSNWEAFDVDERFDVVFASMTPALETETGKEKLLRFANGWIVFMGFSNRMASDVMQGLFAHYGLTPKIFNSTAKMREWLEKKGFAYTAVPVSDEWVVPWSKEELIDSCATTLTSYGVNPDLELIGRHVEAFREDSGKYVERTKYSIEMILWQNS